MSRRARLEQPSRLGAALGAAAIAALAAAGAQAQTAAEPASGRIVVAQSGQLPPPTGGQPAPGATAAPKKQTAPTKQAAPSGGGAASTEPKSSEGGLKSRVDQLEEQMVDLQVTIGTLESIAKTAGTQSSSATFRAPAAGGGGGGSDGARVDALETQIRALVSQVEQLADRVRAMEGGGGGRAAAPQPAPSTAVAGFGRTTVSPARDSIGQLIQDDGSQGQGRQVASAEPAGAGAKQMYEQAYGYLLQQDYAAAETSFSGLLARYPNDPLAGNAQYWLGETYFYRGQFKPAAAAFLKGYQTYSRSPKAPDSLLKLAMSLDRLGQKDAACASFSELNTRFPNAAPDIKSRASSERQRLGCP